MWKSDHLEMEQAHDEKVQIRYRYNWTIILVTLYLVPFSTPTISPMSSCLTGCCDAVVDGLS